MKKDNPLEKEIQLAVGQYAKSKGVEVYPFSSPSRRGVPDRIYINPKGFIWFVEFKRKGERPTPIQEREHQRLRLRNCSVWVIDNVEDGKAMVDLLA